MSFRLVPKSVTLNGVMALFCIIPANLGSFRVHCVKVHVRYMLSLVRLSVCNVRAPYSGGSNFRQYFYGIRYHGHPWTSTENFTEVVSGEPLRRGS